MRADARANRAALVEAAWRLSAAAGAQVPMSAVAQEAGVGIATLYRHFPTQDDLLLGVCAQIRDRVLEICGHHLGGFDTRPETAWAAFVTDLVALRLGALLPQLVEGRSAEDLPAGLQELRRTTLDAIASVLEHARRAGLVRDDVTAVRFHLGLGVLTRPVPHVAEEYVPGYQRWLVEVYLRGLRP